MIQAIIFDFDGTIIDTETPWYNAFQEAYAKHHVELTIDLYSQCVGTSLHTFNPYEYLVTEHKLPIDLKAFKTGVKQRYTELMQQEKIRPGVMDYLDKARAAGLKIGLASSSSQEWIDRHLDQLGIRDYFDCIRTADNVVHVKPDPELYTQTLAGLGVSAQHGLAIEDSPNGARAAAAAGMHYIIVPNPITGLLAFDPTAQNFIGECLSAFDFNQLMANPAAGRVS
ncbi:HAD family hydrolase [Paenibacillaceae bacterium]|nr:HAD family hydrolase [Paenibacillaceae bacterium]